MKKLENARFRRNGGFVEVYTDNTMYTIGGPCYHGGDATRSHNWGCVKVGEKTAAGFQEIGMEANVTKRQFCCRKDGTGLRTNGARFLNLPMECASRSRKQCTR